MCDVGSGGIERRTRGDDGTRYKENKEFAYIISTSNMKVRTGKGIRTERYRVSAARLDKRDIH